MTPHSTAIDPDYEPTLIRPRWVRCWDERRKCSIWRVAYVMGQASVTPADADEQMQSERLFSEHGHAIHKAAMERNQHRFDAIEACLRGAPEPMTMKQIAEATGVPYRWMRGSIELCHGAVPVGVTAKRAKLYVWRDE